MPNIRALLDQKTHDKFSKKCKKLNLSQAQALILLVSDFAAGNTEIAVMVQKTNVDSSHKIYYVNIMDENPGRRRMAPSWIRLPKCLNLNQIWRTVERYLEFPQNLIHLFL